MNHASPLPVENLVSARFYWASLVLCSAFIGWLIALAVPLHVR